MMMMIGSVQNSIIIIPTYILEPSVVMAVRMSGSLSSWSAGNTSLMSSKRFKAMRAAIS